MDDNIEQRKNGKRDAWEEHRHRGTNNWPAVVRPLHDPPCIDSGEPSNEGQPYVKDDCRGKQRAACSWRQETHRGQEQGDRCREDDLNTRSNLGTGKRELA